MLNLSVQDETEGATGICSTGLIKVKDTAVSIEGGWLYFDAKGQNTCRYTKRKQ